MLFFFYYLKLRLFNCICVLGSSSEIYMKKTNAELVLSTSYVFQLNPSKNIKNN